MSASRVGALFILPVLAACGTVADPTEPEVGCTDEGGASVIAEIRDPAGRPAAIGATMILREGTYADTVGPADVFDELRKAAGNRRPGRYSVVVRKPGYDRIVLQGVVAQGGPCGVVTPTVVQVKLELTAGAPRVRSIVVLQGDRIRPCRIDRAIAGRRGRGAGHSDGGGLVVVGSGCRLGFR